MPACNYRDPATATLCGKKALYKDGAEHRCSAHRLLTTRHLKFVSAVRASTAIANDRERALRTRDNLRRKNWKRRR